VEENDLDNDYDRADEELTDLQTPSEAPEQIPQERSIKAYLVKRTAHKTSVGDSDTRTQA
jgi:hypothetical protein